MKERVLCFLILIPRVVNSLRSGYVKLPLFAVCLSKKKNAAQPFHTCTDSLDNSRKNIYDSFNFKIFSANSTENYKREKLVQRYICRPIFYRLLL